MGTHQRHGAAGRLTHGEPCPVPTLIHTPTKEAVVSDAIPSRPPLGPSEGWAATVMYKPPKWRVRVAQNSHGGVTWSVWHPTGQIMGAFLVLEEAMTYAAWRSQR